jgi:hypothetical protein
VNLPLFVNVQPKEKKVRAADAKEVGVGNPAEETYRYPNQILLHPRTLPRFVNAYFKQNKMPRRVGDSPTPPPRLPTFPKL